MCPGLSDGAEREIERVDEKEMNGDVPWIDTAAGLQSFRKCVLVYIVTHSQPQLFSGTANELKSAGLCVEGHSPQLGRAGNYFSLFCVCSVPSCIDPINRYLPPRKWMDELRPY